MTEDIYEDIDKAVKRNTTSAIYGAVGALADTQAQLITLLLERGILTSLAAQQMINELDNTEYSQPPLNDTEQVRRKIVKWTATHLQSQVDWNRAADQ